MSRRAVIVAGLALTFVAAVAGLALFEAPGASPESLTDAAPESPRPTGKEATAVQETQTLKRDYTNRLINETSPYLLQHAHNPVDWYPWGEEALGLARELDRPIFLSVGYSSCHWCHVMERESFENEAIAALMNRFFVCIKVDREERPDIDDIYMAAVQAMTGSGGWPMSVFLTPELKPFYGGTYFPPEDAYGRPGFKTLLQAIADMWAERRDELLQGADRVSERIERVLNRASGPSGPLTVELMENATRSLGASFDPDQGGFGRAPKFPSSPSIALLLREYDRTKKSHLLNMALVTLDNMAYGGIYDHLGGGFARYSTDAEWLVPHFEKMLYDNAQLSLAYLEAYQVTGKKLYRRVVEEIFEYELRDMRDPAGGFYSAEDADSEGEEGKFYLWSYAEVLEHLGEADGDLFGKYYGLRPKGNFSSREAYHGGMNILHMPATAEELAQTQGLTVEALEGRMAPLRAKLLAVRSGRVRPGLDDKVLTSWNALMISSLAQGYQVLGETRYREAAEEAAHFILNDMMRDGALLRTHRKGESRLPAYLEDYAFLIVALADLYEATFDIQWLEAADGLARTMIDKFWDADRAEFFFTSDDHENLLVRPRPTHDGAIPSGNSMAALGLLRLAKFFDNRDYYEKARHVLEANRSAMAQAPMGYLKMLCAVDFVLRPPKEIALAGTPGSEGIETLLGALHGAFVPNKIVALIDPSGSDASALGKRLPLLAGKKLISGRAAAYVCKDFTCKLPVTAPEDFLAQLGIELGEA